MASDALTTVTDEQWTVILPDLEKLLKTKQKKDEDLPAYVRRLARAVNDPKKVGDDDWETLAEITQQWANGASLADEKGDLIALPPSVAALVEEAEEVGEEAPETETAPPAAATPKKAGNGKKPAKTAPPKKAAAAKPAKAAAAKKPAKATAAKKAGRPALFGEADVITIKEKEPFRAGSMSAIGFAKMKSGMTVKKAIEAGTPRRLIRWSNICEYIEIRPAA